MSQAGQSLKRITTAQTAIPRNVADNEDAYSSVDAHDDDENDFENTEDDIGYVATNEMKLEMLFKSLYLVGHCDDDENRDKKCCSVATLLFSCTNDVTDYSLHIVDDRFLEGTVMWPETLTDPLKLHDIWLQGMSTTKLIKYQPLIKFCNYFFPKHRYGIVGLKALSVYFSDDS